MRNFFIKKNKQKGYAILFTIVLVSAISVITAGLTNAVYKQMVLSSLASDSQSAFYQSDTATDCALYADRVQRNLDPTFNTTSHSWLCGGTNMVITPKVNGNGGYNIDPTPEVQATSDPCFRIDITKDISNPPFIATTVKAKGYNFCDFSNPRTVEREIEIKYQEDPSI